MQAVAEQANGSSDVTELMGLYLHASGKDANAKVQDKNGNMQSVDVNSLSLSEMQGVAQGDKNALKARNAKQEEKTKEKWVICLRFHRNSK
mgnify:CR=1 FL=1